MDTLGFEIKKMDEEGKKVFTRFINSIEQSSWGRTKTAKGHCRREDRYKQFEMIEPKDKLRIFYKSVDGTLKKCEVDNISRNGFCVKVRDYDDVGRSLFVMFIHDEKVYVEAEVRYFNRDSGKEKTSMIL